MDDSNSMIDRTALSLSAMIGSGITTVVLGSALAYAFLDTRRKSRKFVATAANSSTLTNGDSKQKPEEGIDRAKYPGGNLYVYYATQTGTAESFARQLEREGPEYGFIVHARDLEDVDIKSLVQMNTKTEERARAIFLVSTYGEGEPPDTAAQFVQLLQEQANMVSLNDRSSIDDSNNDESLSGLEYCVFGLGNKQYEHYNAMGKFLDYALQRIGASRLIPVGLGNEDDDLEADFEAWKEVLWLKLKEKYITETFTRKQDVARKSAPAVLPDCPYIVNYHDVKTRSHLSVEEARHSGRTSFTAVRQSFASFDIPVKVVRELRSSEDTGSTVHVELDITDSGLSYETADNLGVLPVNSSAIVESVAKCLGYDLDLVFSLSGAPNHDWHGAPFPQPLSIRDCLSRYCDLTCAPRRSDLKLLAEYAKDSFDRDALLRMASKDGRAEYKEKILENYIGIADILKLCPSVKMPLEHFLNVCPQLQTRFFTISSSSSVHPNSIHITVAVAQHERKDGSVFKGVCSNYLAEPLPSQQKMVRAFIRPSTFRLPADTTKPILMIGPGTGIAPMRALLQERAFQRTSLNKTIGKNILYFGCKKRTFDFLYRDEILGYQQSGNLDKVYLAFSREQKEKIYVQHLLKENAEETWSLLHNHGAYVYVCGGVKMGSDVSEAFKEIACTQGNLNLESARDYFLSLTRDGRYVQELWA